MTDAQRERYDIEKNRIRNVLFENKEDLFNKNKFIALQGLMRLRLLANHPSLIDSDYHDDSGKLDQIILYIENLRASGHKVLIFSSFVKHLKLLSDRFDCEGWKYAMLTGQTPNREEEINKFIQQDDVNCFFISLKAGGTGLNLTAADYVFIIDPWWNPASEMQAFSRAHRIGQDKNVIVYRFISSDSIEEKIIRLQQSKLQLFDTFITSNNPLEQLGRQEIEELFL
jgi:SNF2 family DNA or RNA helicase